MLPAGKMIERYVVEDQLGAGGVATVYRVRHTTLGSLHALKVLQLTGSAIRDRLVEEGKVQANLKHPNIVTVTDVLDVDGSPGLIMEYIDGPSLDRWLHHNRPTPEQAEALFRGILAGVARAHRVGLVHRDLKPGNVLLATTEEGVVPKVADFGLSKVLIEDQAGRAETRSGIAMGTPAYMAPEQVRDAKSVDQRADIFALGCILYELYLGASPFDGPDVLTIFSKLASGSYVAPEELDPTLPPRIREAIVGCLQARREDRIADCAALRAVLDGGVYVPTGTSWTGRSQGASGGASMSGGASGVPVAVPARDEGASTTAQSGVRRSAAPTVALSQVADEAEVARVLGGAAGPAATSGASAPTPAVEPPKATKKGGMGAFLVAGVVGGGLVLGLGVLALGGLWYWSSQGGTPPVTTAPILNATTPSSTVPTTTPSTVPTTTPSTVPTTTPSTVPTTTPSTVPTATPSTVPTTTPSTVPHTPPRPAGGATGTVSVTGDASEVWLVGRAGRVSVGEVPAGSYEVHATFAGESVSAGRVMVTPGRVVTLNCNADFQRCVAR